MKTIYFITVVLFSLSCNAQQLGNYKINIETNTNSSSKLYEEWIREDGHVTMKFRMNPVGLAHAVDKVQEILDSNKMLDALPAFDDTSKGSDITDEENMEQWHKSILKGYSEVKKGYMFPNAKLLQIFFVIDGYELNIIGL